MGCPCLNQARILISYPPSLFLISPLLQFSKPVLSNSPTMASLLQPTSTSCSFTHSTLFTFSSPPSPTFTTFKPHQPTPLFSTTKASPFHQTPTQLPRRKLFCKPLFAKYIREDYLVKKVSAKEVEELVKGERDVPLVVDFYATWCGPCTIMAQELEMLAVEYENNALIVKVDTDDEYEFARDMQVRGLPTLYFISPDPSKEAIRTEGLIPIQMMRDIINEL